MTEGERVSASPGQQGQYVDGLFEMHLAIIELKVRDHSELQPNCGGVSGGRTASGVTFYEFVLPKQSS